MSASISDAWRPIGGWLDRPDNIRPALAQHTSADVIVVGGGFAGLTTAIELATQGKEVVLLEQEFAGFGASGRNAGYLAGGQGLEYELFLKRVGHEQARAIVGFYQDGVSYVEANLERFGIDCDYNPSGIIRAAVHPSQEKRLRENMAIGNELGAPSRFLDRREMRERGIPPAFLCGVLTPNGGTLDPGKYVLGLRQAAIGAGVRLYENSPVISWSEGVVVRCETIGGSVEAPFAVFATNAWSPGLGLLRDKVAPLRVSALETEPLTQAQIDALGWPGREGIVTPHFVMESHRLTARDTLVLTTKRLDYVYGNETPNVADEASYRALAGLLAERFPAIGPIGIRSCWSGYITFAYDALPVVGGAGAHGNVLYTAGCSGHGVGTQSFVGSLLAMLITGTEHPTLTALRHNTPKTWPEPLQWGAVKAALGAAHALDRRTDRKARKLTARSR